MEYRRKRRRKGGLLRKLFCLFLVVWMGLLGYCILRDGTEWVTGKLAGNSTAYDEAYTIAENVDILQGIRQEVWLTLTDAEKQTVLQTVANAEANYLGVRKPLPVCVTELENGVLGRYRSDIHEIQIDESFLERAPVQEIIVCICHEAYHAYQFAMAMAYADADQEAQDLLFFQTAKIYLEEFENYQNGQDKEHYAEYYNQKLEEKAREYSRIAVYDYYAGIEE